MDPTSAAGDETTTPNPPNDAVNASSDDASTPSNPLSPPPPDDDTTTTTTASDLPLPKRRRKRKHYPAGVISMVLRPHSSRPSSFSLHHHLSDAAVSLPSSRRRRRRRDDPSSSTSSSLSVDALIALSVGFPVDSLTEEEIEADVIPTLAGDDQKPYIAARNYLLSRWRSDVSTPVSLSSSPSPPPSLRPDLLRRAHSFLLHHGYINFGLSPEIKHATMSDGLNSSVNVIVVGAGLAGLCAGRQLRSMGFKVVILEGRARPGGRVRTRKMSGEGNVVGAADLGGSVITGINGNPLGVLARQLGFPLHKVRDICPLYLPNGKTVDKEIDSRVETAFNKLLDRVCKLRQVMMEEINCVDVSLGTALEAFRKVFNVADDPQEKMLMNWHLANLEYANASLLSKLSMAFWDQDDPYEMGGDHCFIPGGNERFIRALAEEDRKSVV